MRSARRLMCAAGLMLFVVFVVSACGSSSSSSSVTASSGGTSHSAKSPFVVLAVVDTSGPTKAYGEVQKAGLQGTAAYLNANGGILGHPVEVKIINDNGTPETATAGLLKYMSEGNPKPNMVWPGTSAGDSAALLPLLERYNLLGIGTVLGSGCNANAQSICPTAFLPSGGLASSVPAMVQYMEAKGYKHVGLLLEDGPIAQTVLNALPSQKTITFTTVKYPPTAVDLQPQVSQLASAGAQAIYFEGLSPAPGYAGNARSELGLVDKIPLVFGAIASAVDLTKLMSPAELKNAYETAYAVNLPSEAFPGRELMIQYSKPFGGVTSQPLNLAAFAWTALILARDAAEQAGSIEADPMIEALKNLDKKAQTDPLYTTAFHLLFTEGNHQNAAPGDEKYYPIVTISPVANGMLTNSEAQ